MCNTGLIDKTLFAEGASRRGIIYLSLTGWLLLVAIIAKMFLGCSANLREAALPFNTTFFKIADSACHDSETVGRIEVLNYWNSDRAFLEKNVFIDDAKPAYNISALAEIGGMSFPMAPVKKTATLNRSKLLTPVIKRAAARYQVDPALVRAIIFAESGYNTNAVSKRGAMGLMQLMPGTAKAMGVENCFDPEHNIYGGVKYFKKLFNQFDGDVKLALAAYNAGSRKVRQFNGVPPFRETEHYVQKVLKYYQIYKDQKVEPVGLS